MNDLFANFRKVDEELLEELEDVLIMSDMGMETTEMIIDRLRERAKHANIKTREELEHELIDIITESMLPAEPLHLSSVPSVILIVGVNGVGKTTTIGKLASQLTRENKKVLLVAGDTFRAAASDQLKVWAERVNVPIVIGGERADPSAVLFDAIQSAKAHNTEIIICDTAGRLHNNKNLMQELAKMHKIIDRELGGADIETLLVLDATTGQNAIIQAQEFNKVTELTGLILTKLDGSAKGGAIIGVSHELSVPIKFVGVGEGIEDLLPFDNREFVEALFD